MKPLQQYFHMVLFVMYVVLTFESVDEILWCYHSNETSWAELSHSTIYLVGCYNFVSSPKGLNGSTRTGVCPCTIRLQTWSAEPEVAALIPGAEPILKVLK